MPLSRKIIAPAMFLGAAAVAAGGATLASGMIEDRSEAAVSQRLAQDGLTFATAQADGLDVHLTGTAPDEAARFRVLNLAGSVVDPSRLRDDMTVTPSRPVEAPPFEMEILRNDDGVSLIGLVPAASSAMLADTAGLVPGIRVTDMLESADYPAPDQWNAAMNFGIEALKILPRAKISISAAEVAVTAIADNMEQQQRLKMQLAQATPPGLKTQVDITAPRPVITPYALQLVKDEGGVRFDACSAPDDDQARTVLEAARAIGVATDATCAVGLGAPSAEWTRAVTAGITALGALPAGRLTLSDADVTLTGQPGMAQNPFNAAAGTLQSALPDGFSLKTVLPELPAQVEGPSEFVAVSHPDGTATLTGRVRDALGQEAVTSFARASFGAADVSGEPVIDPDMPAGWTTRIIAGLEALAQLSSGELRITPEELRVSGVTGSQSAQAQITDALTRKLGSETAVTVDAAYDEDLDPYAALPSPQECVTRINAVMTKQKISFAPGSAEIDGSARSTLDGLAEILTDCANLSFEIQGYTDSQGSDTGNQALSQARAEAVLIALQGRRIDANRLTARGFGEENPIASNGSEDGREANRRIEFKLTEVAPDPNAAPKAQDTPARKAMLAIARIDGFLLPQGDWIDSVPADMVDGSGDGEEGGDEGGEAEVDGEPSFAPTEATERPERRPEDL
ncbi:OmpA family protein [Falsirhodobacter sp. 20TX0035]|uniref:OmpA family protein n=1 Tax=Falsirhodobacter sp. 20TX0035 TaxID=3022019 RepID=UPI002330711E|nr:OmpA family protein [Falsirhodobacter sp. 20TX0035]MDB6452237.1 OmpA family protein [Falsirhodobacter sp. 20TX0035]